MILGDILRTMTTNDIHIAILRMTWSLQFALRAPRDAAETLVLCMSTRDWTAAQIMDARVSKVAVTFERDTTYELAVRKEFARLV